MVSLGPWVRTGFAANQIRLRSRTRGGAGIELPSIRGAVLRVKRAQVIG